MKVFMMDGPLMGCNYVRLLLPMWANGWDGNYVGLNSPTKTVDMCAKSIEEADVVVFHRPENHLWHKVALECKRAGKKIVFDNDDTFKLDTYHPFYAISGKKFKKNVKMKNDLIYNFIHNSDLVTTTTDFLAEEYKSHNDNVLVLPNCVNPMDWGEPERNEGDVIRIGLTGSVSYAHDFEVIGKLIQELGKRDDVKIILFGQNSIGKAQNKLLTKDERALERRILKKELAFWGGIKNIEHFPWCPMHEYFDTLNETKMDLMLIPRRDNNFNKAKSNVKYLEASMLEIPCIMSKFKDGNSPYEKDIDGENGILVKNTLAEWRDAVNKLIDDKKLRRKMGKIAKKYVLKNYDINKRGKEWLNAYKKLIKK
jgi:glycosyltransferase involved in cell wall biosynthesis